MNRIRSLALAGALAAAAFTADGASAQVQPAPPATPAAGAQQQQAAAPERRRASRRRQEVITRDELEESNARDLYEAVERLRPQWLRPRGVTNFGGTAGTAIVVYQGDTPMGGLEALRSMGLEFAQELRYLDSSQASNTLPGLGSRSVAGAIVVVRPGTTR